MTKSKRPTTEMLRSALLQKAGGRVAAMNELRRAGYTGTTGWFMGQFAEIEGKVVKHYNTKGRINATTGAGSGSDNGPESSPEGSGDEGEEDEEGDLELGGYVQSRDKDRTRLGAGRYVFTSAQSNTKVHQGFFDALMKYCAVHDAELHVAAFTYNKASMGAKSVKPGTKKKSDNESLWFDPQIKPYLSDVSLEVGDGLIWCGELNIIPTRINPLSSFTTYTRNASAIIPHAKIALQSVPTMKSDPAKFLYSTGAITQRNYIQKTSGQVAEFHHVFGALVVDVDENGQWYPRHINACDDGSFIDITTEYMPDGKMRFQRALAMNHGDIHGDKMDTAIMQVVFGDRGLLERFRPEFQFLHDTIDFMPRNHHNIKDPHFLHSMFVNDTESVKAEFTRTASYVAKHALRPWVNTYLVESNHDMAIDQWLRNPAGQFDPQNARTWHEWNAKAYKKREEFETPRPFWEAFQEGLPTRLNGFIDCLHEDDSFVLRDIEFGLHGHLGPNGARGNPKNLRSVGKANTGHTHSCGIVDGVYTAGVYGKLDMGYNKGLSSWSHSFVITYANGKRAVFTIKNGKAFL